MKTLFKVEYDQRFRGARDWLPYTNTVAVSGDALTAANKMVKIALGQSLDTRPCTGVRIKSIVTVSAIDHG